MAVKTIPLSQLEANPQATLSACADSGATVVIELPDHRLVALQPLDPADGEDSLVDELLKSNAAFRDLVARSKAGPRAVYTGQPT